jgi:hypothetical protein
MENTKQLYKRIETFEDVDILVSAIARPFTFMENCTKIEISTFLKFGDVSVNCSNLFSWCYSDIPSNQIGETEFLNSLNGLDICDAAIKAAKSVIEQIKNIKDANSCYQFLLTFCKFENDVNRDLVNIALMFLEKSTKNEKL